MKRFIIGVIGILLLFGLSGCGESSSNAATNTLSEGEEIMHYITDGNYSTVGIKVYYTKLDGTPEDTEHITLFLYNTKRYDAYYSNSMYSGTWRYDSDTLYRQGDGFAEGTYKFIGWFNKDTLSFKVIDENDQLSIYQITTRY